MGNISAGSVHLLLASLSLSLVSCEPSPSSVRDFPIIILLFCLAFFPPPSLLSTSHFSCKIQRCAMGQIWRPLVVGRPCAACGGTWPLTSLWHLLLLTPFSLSTCSPGTHPSRLSCTPLWVYLVISPLSAPVFYGSHSLWNSSCLKRHGKPIQTVVGKPDEA